MPIHNLFRVNPATVAASPRCINPFSGEDDGPGLGASGAYLFYTPRAIPVHEVAIARNTVPGGGGLRVELINGTEGGTQTGADADLGAAATSSRTVVTGTWTVFSDATTASGRHLELSTISGTTTADDNNITLLYQDASIPELSWYAFGDRVANLLSAVAADTDRFTSFGISDAVSATESDVQVPWPISGIFQHVGICFLMAGAGAGNVTLVLRINGADTAITFTLTDTGGQQVTSNSVLTANVSAGDLVSWRMRQAAPAGDFACSLICGFMAN